MQQDDIKILLLPKGYQEKINLPHFDSYIRDEDTKGRFIKRPVANNYWPASFGPEQCTPEGYLFAWVADTEHNREQVRKLSEAGRICLDNPSLLDKWFPKEDVTVAKAAKPVVEAPVELPLEMETTVAFTEEDLKGWTKVRLLEEITRQGKTANPTMKNAELITILLG